MKETEIGNCGSKSIKKFIVKEQKVNGSLFFKLQLKNIRWTLMGFKRNYQIRILSNQLKIIFFFIYSLFIIILINNFLGMVTSSFASTSHFIDLTIKNFLA